MMDVMQRYQLWCANATEDDELSRELVDMRNDETRIFEAFYQTLSFGTAGLRGILGAGDNRMNIYTIRRATQGLANFLLTQDSSPSVAIAYDTRRNSLLFSREAASVLAANGIKVYLYDDIMPTPMLSWAVRTLSCQSGIVVTASHNPKEYNGYKVYGDDGCQITAEAADAILAQIDAVDPFSGVARMPFEDALSNGKVEFIAQSVIDAFYERALGCLLQKDLLKTSDLKLAYTPLCGTGNKPVRHVLDKAGLREVYVVAAQENPDSSFSTCPYPNPEAPEAMELGVKLAQSVNADILIGTDPDADRVGVFVMHNGEMVRLSGNDVGVLLCDYVCRTRKQLGTLPERGIMIKSIVSTPLADWVAESYGVEMRSVLTGFKHIGTEIARIEQEGRGDDFLFAYEESCGYMPRSHVRDKDAVASTLLVCEMAAYYKSIGKTLVDGMDDIYKKHGFLLERSENIAFVGADGMKQMQKLMDDLFASPFAKIAHIPVASWSDLRRSIRYEGDAETPILLPTSDVAVFDLSDGSKIIVRPSGTEPKLKIYYMIKGENQTEAEKLFQLSKDAVHIALKL